MVGPKASWTAAERQGEHKRAKALCNLADRPPEPAIGCRQLTYGTGICVPTRSIPAFGLFSPGAPFTLPLPPLPPTPPPPLIAPPAAEDFHCRIKRSPFRLFRAPPPKFQSVRCVETLPERFFFRGTFERNRRTKLSRKILFETMFTQQIYHYY